MTKIKPVIDMGALNENARLRKEITRLRAELEAVRA